MPTSQLDLSGLPPIYILPTHLSSDDLHEAEDELGRCNGRLTYQTVEARIFVGKVNQKKRAAFELRAKGLWTEEIEWSSLDSSGKESQRGYKRKRNDDDDKGLSDNAPNDLQPPDEPGNVRSSQEPAQIGASASYPNLIDHIVVLKMDWLERSIKQEAILPFDQFLVYSGKIVANPTPNRQSGSRPINNAITFITATPGSPNQSHNAHATNIKGPANTVTTPFQRRRMGGSTSTSMKHYDRSPPTLHRTTTSEMEDISHSSIPSPPEWLLAPQPQPLYSCLRSTFSRNPNSHFIAQLSKIKEARLLTLDEIGVRAYSTSIAALSAYPHRITSPVEVTRLPGCDEKIAALWIEWHSSIRNLAATADTEESKYDSHEDSRDAQRTISVVTQLESDYSLNILRRFYQIWGVGPETAQKFHYTNGWTDLDDIVEYGWNSLSRVQQIGVKFYHEFQQPILKDEAENIAKTVVRHARKCRNIPKAFWSTRKPTDTNTSTHTDTNTKSKSNTKVEAKASETLPSWSWEDPHGKHTDPRDFIAIIVGGYRRGNATMGDVDIILSHRDDRMTQDLIVDLIASLETEGHITHTLSLLTTTSDRSGETLPYNANHTGHGFDSLDKALCVWQQPEPAEDENGKTRKNTNVHRRVDIIISPFRTLGCAVLGWSGGTTFQRDIRRWVKREKGWKFDSSGVRDRGNGLVLDLESVPEHSSGNVQGASYDNDQNDQEEESKYRYSDGWEDRERRVMEAMGIGWRPANERCTG